MNGYLCVRPIFPLFLLLLLSSLLIPTRGGAQPNLNVTIDEVDFRDGLITVTVSNSSSSALNAMVRLYALDLFNPDNPTLVGKAPVQVVMLIPGSCTRYRLPPIRLDLYPGEFEVSAELGAADGTGAPWRQFSIFRQTSIRDHQFEFHALHSHHGSVNDPVSTLSGELYFTEEPDLFLPGPIPLTFQRSWSSRALPHLVGMPTLGILWRHNYDAAAFRVDDTVRVILPSGRPIDFLLDGGEWRRMTLHERDVRLVSVGDTLVYGDPTDPYLYYFGPRGLLAAIGDLAGNRLTLSYTGRFLDRVEDGLGRALSLTYDSIGRLTSVSDGVREVTFQTSTFSRNLGENLRTLVDPLGAKTIYFNATVPDIHRQLLLSRYTPRGNRPWTQAYDSLGRVTTQTDADGSVHRYVYRDDPALTLIINPDGDTVIHQHDGRIEGADMPRVLTGVRDQEGEKVRFGYQKERLTTIVNREGDSTSFEYDDRGRLTNYRDPEGFISSYQYEEINLHGISHSLLTTEDLPDGTGQAWEYDARGNPVAFTDRAGNRFLYEYNDRGMLLSETLPTGGLFRYEYDAAMNLIAMTDPAGNRTTLARDNLGRLIGATLADGSSVTIELDALDRVSAVTDAEGNRREVEYDANGNVIGTVDPAGATTSFRYDLMERLDTAVDRRGGITTFDFTPYGELRQMTNADGGTIAWEHDRRGLVTGVVDEVGRMFGREHDAEGRVVRSIDPLGDATSREHDRRGFLTAITTPEGNRLSIERDAMGRASHITSSTGRSTSIEYEGTGQPMRIATGEGVESRYERNGLGQVTAIVDPNGRRWENEYDQGGRMTLRRDPLGRTTLLRYDVRNRVDSVIFPGELGSKAITYDRNGDVIAERWSDGTAIDYERDALGRVTVSDGVTLGYDAEGEVISSNGITLERDLMGRPRAITLAAGRRVEYSYNTDGTLQSVRDWNGNEIMFDYDAEGKLTQISRPNGVSTTWTYDRDNQWRAITHGSIARMEFERDAEGRITAAERELPLEPTLLPSIRSFGYDDASQQSGVDHDAMGRVVRDDERSYTWDLATRLTSLKRPEGSTTMRWNADGFLSGIFDGTLDHELVWNYGLAIPSISVERRSGTDHMYYLHTPGGRLLARIDAGTGDVDYYHFDENGSTLFLTDAEGSIVGSWAYLPYGESAGESGGVENLFTWGGEYGAIGLGDDLYNLRARWYDAAAGRFLSGDPIHSILPTEMNPYQYVEGDPVQLVDINGRSGTNWEAEITRLELEAAAQERLDQWKQDVVDPLNELEQKILDDAVRSAERRANENRERMERERQNREALAKKKAEQRKKEVEDEKRWNDKMAKKAAEIVTETGRGSGPDRIPDQPKGTGGTSTPPAPPSSSSPIPAPTETPDPVPTTDPTPSGEPTDQGGSAVSGGGASGTGMNTGAQVERMLRKQRRATLGKSRNIPGADIEGYRLNREQINQAKTAFSALP